MANNQTYRILTLDPGLTHTGWALLQASLNNDTVVVLKIGEFHPGPTVEKKSYRDEVEKFDKRTISLAYLREQLTKLLLDLRPDEVCAEDIFINPHRPAAYGALAMHQCVTKMVCYDVVKKHLITIPTKIAKAALTKSGSSDKLTVQQCVASNTDIKFKNEDDLNHMTEHEADSIAVGYALAKLYKDRVKVDLGINQ